jgi:mediator of replication checkpoint protein 1
MRRVPSLNASRHICDWLPIRSGWRSSSPTRHPPRLMTLCKEDSIAEDSTISTSPVPLKRVARTYGRPKDTRVEPDSSFTDLPCTSASRHSIYRTGPTDTKEEIPPTSDVQLSDDEGGQSLAKSPSSSPKFRWSWQAKLLEIDRTDDLDDGLHASSASGNTPPIAESKDSDPFSSPERRVNTSPTDVEPSSDVFGGSLRSLPASSSQHSPGTFLAQSRRVRNRVKKASTVVHDSDSDEAVAPSSNTSPVFPHPINTPKSGSSPTPPTSDADVDMETSSDIDMPLTKTRSKWKGKARAVSASGDASDSMTMSKENANSATDRTKSRNRKVSKTKVFFPSSLGQNLLLQCLSFIGSCEERSS